MGNVSQIKVASAILSNPQIVFGRPSVNWFLCRYLRKFKPVDVGGKLFLHSHLPPLNSRAYSRFISEHLLAKSEGPSHAQIGITNACPQDCSYCYNKNRTGRVMDEETILKTIRELKEIGVFWIGLTGGEPLLNKNIVRIVEEIGDDCASKLFTTGSTLTKQRALELKNAGLFSVSVSLDHWNPEEHDRIRRTPGAFQTAFRAIETFRDIGGVHIGVSAVLSKSMWTEAVVEEYLEFLGGLGIHEAWLSETKPCPSLEEPQEEVISPREREMLVRVQDRHNAMGGMTVNYLGHFEDARYFGCAAGHKMVYVDAFGETGPCVFVPMSFGNIREKSVKEITRSMRSVFPSESDCFVNKNHCRLRECLNGRPVLPEAESELFARETSFGPLAKFFALQYR